MNITKKFPTPHDRYSSTDACVPQSHVNQDNPLVSLNVLVDHTAGDTVSTLRKPCPGQARPEYLHIVEHPTYLPMSIEDLGI